MQTIEALGALAQQTRLSVFRSLIAAYPRSVAAGDVARRCHVPHNTMSTHLGALVRAGLVSVARDGRSMLYRADLSGFRSLLGFLTRDCCSGRLEICAPLLDGLQPACDCQPESIDA